MAGCDFGFLCHFLTRDSVNWWMQEPSSLDSFVSRSELVNSHLVYIKQTLITLSNMNQLPYLGILLRLWQGQITGSAQWQPDQDPGDLPTVWPCRKTLGGLSSLGVASACSIMHCRPCLGSSTSLYNQRSVGSFWVWFCAKQLLRALTLQANSRDALWNGLAAGSFHHLPFPGTP